MDKTSHSDEAEFYLLNHTIPVKAVYWSIFRSTLSSVANLIEQTDWNKEYRIWCRIHHLFILGHSQFLPKKNTTRISSIGPSSQERDEQDSGACAGTLNRTKQGNNPPRRLPIQKIHRFNIKTSEKGDCGLNHWYHAQEKHKESRGRRSFGKSVRTRAKGRNTSSTAR